MDYPKRKNMRLAGYDYGKEGSYFLTVCTFERRCVLSRIIYIGAGERPQVKLTNLGLIADQVLRETAEQMGLNLDASVIMPNHIHLLVTIDRNSQTSVGRFVGAFKSITANRWRKVFAETPVTKLWQRDYYDHIIRNEADFIEKLKYIDENPDRWEMDEMYV